MRKDKKQDRVLRVGVVQKGRVIEEYKQTKKENLSVGSHYKSALMIPEAGLPEKFDFFSFRNGQYYLCYSKDVMKGQLKQKGDSFSLEECAKNVVAIHGAESLSSIKGLGDVIWIPISDPTRGKVAIGELTFLFQMIDAPMKKKKDPVPVFSWKPRVDWIYASVLLTSFVGHSGFVYWCHSMGELPSANTNNRFTRMIDSWKTFTVPPEMKRQTPKKTPVTSKFAKKKHIKKKRHIRKPVIRKPIRKGFAKANVKKPRIKQSASDIRSKLQKFGMFSGMKKGAFQRVIGSKVGEKLTKSLEGSKVASIGGLRSHHARRRDSKRREIAVRSYTLPNSEGSRVGNALVQRRKRKTTKISKRIRAKFERIREIHSISRDSVMALVRRKRLSLRYCYESEVKKNYALSGKILLRVEIKGNGRVHRVEVESNQLNKRVANCMKRKISRWRFPRPKGSLAEVVLPFVFTASR